MRKHFFSFLFFQLNGTVKQNKYVQPLSLPDFYEDIKPGTKCKVAGWGNTSSGKPSKYLQETTLKIVDRKSCKNKYRKYIKITSNMLCAVGEKIYRKGDACQVRSKVTKRRGCAFYNGFLFTGNRAVLDT